MKALTVALADGANMTFLLDNVDAQDVFLQVCTMIDQHDANDDVEATLSEVSIQDPMGVTEIVEDVIVEVIAFRNEELQPRVETADVKKELLG